MDFLQYCNFSDDGNALQGVICEEADVNEYAELTDLDTYSSSNSISSDTGSVEYMQVSDSQGYSETSSPVQDYSPYQMNMDQGNTPCQDQNTLQEQYIKTEVDFENCSEQSYDSFQNQNIKCEIDGSRKS